MSDLEATRGATPIRELVRHIALSGVELSNLENLVVLYDACLQTGAREIELWYPRNFDSDLDLVRHRFAESGIRISCLSGEVELYRDSDAGAQQTKLMHIMDVAAEIGAPIVNTFFGFSAVQDDERSIEAYLNLIAPCLKKAEELGLSILVENEFNAFDWDPASSDVTRRPKAFRRLLERAGTAHIGTTFDPANYVCAGVDPLLALRLLAPFVRHVHVKDVVEIANKSDLVTLQNWRRFADFDRSYSTCPLGEGLVDWPSVLSELANLGYSGSLCLEPHAELEHRAAAWFDSYSALKHLLTKD